MYFTSCSDFLIHFTTPENLDVHIAKSLKCCIIKHYLIYNQDINGIIKRCSVFFLQKVLIHTTFI